MTVKGNASNELLDAMSAVNRLHEKHFKERNAHALCDNYFLENSIMSGDGGFVDGFDALVAWWDYAMTNPPFSLSSSMLLDPKIVNEDGDNAYDVGSFYFYFDDPKMDDVEGRYHLRWKKDPDLGWRVITDFWTVGSLYD